MAVLTFEHLFGTWRMYGCIYVCMYIYMHVACSMSLWQFPALTAAEAAAYDTHNSCTCRATHTNVHIHIYVHKFHIPVCVNMLLAAYNPCARPHNIHINFFFFFFRHYFTYLPSFFSGHTSIQIYILSHCIGIHRVILCKHWLTCLPACLLQRHHRHRHRRCCCCCCWAY